MEEKKFRQYNKASDIVREQYRLARKHQTVEFVRDVKKNFEARSPVEMTVWEAIDKLDRFVDLSDPDLLNLANLHHLFQTAEAIRADGHPEWMQLVGLIHDLGKVLYLWNQPDNGISLEQQWGIVGDTFLVDYPIPDCMVYPEFNRLNPIGDKINRTPGLDRHLCSWGHDEYLYQVLQRSLTGNEPDKLPDFALNIIRYHSLYVWHQGEAYQELMDSGDRRALPWIRLFNQYDLYTKEDRALSKTELDELKIYYQKLINRYLPERLLF